MLFSLRELTVFLITVSVLRPKKSNFTSPAFSDHFMSNCVTGISFSESKSLYKGTISSICLSAITIPAA